MAGVGSLGCQMAGDDGRLGECSGGRSGCRPEGGGDREISGGMEDVCG
jgi:hypothetical protein